MGTDPASALLELVQRELEIQDQLLLLHEWKFDCLEAGTAAGKETTLESFPQYLARQRTIPQSLVSPSISAVAMHEPADAAPKKTKSGSGSLQETINVALRACNDLLHVLKDQVIPNEAADIDALVLMVKQESKDPAGPVPEQDEPIIIE
ncbi:hypothetical protein HDV03_001083 [Kappamyces sp. JEL0829]|nr:hypothetical protein HDV03_001083 [Kappamyces sp. JEL0829]KAJ3368621.1 hypothetical protein HDU91_000415 [Kappamyces sp. JEL0680]